MRLSVILFVHSYTILQGFVIEPPFEKGSTLVYPRVVCIMIRGSNEYVFCAARSC
jgi:hypothetical protein